jgi:hypothetical protein
MVNGLRSFYLDSEPMPNAAGTRLDPYDIVSVLDAGGMGEVYRATNTGLKRGVAIEVLPASAG